MSRRRRKITRKRLLLLLLAGSLVAVVLPPSITGRLISLTQVFLPFQDWLSRSADATGELVDGASEETVSPEDWAASQRSNEALRHQVAALSQQLQALHQDYDALSRVRDSGLTDGRLIPARVVGADVLSYRQSRLINGGTLSGIKRDAPVLSDYFTIDLGDLRGLSTGMSVLSGEVLVGFVDQPGTHAARVRLLSDPSTRLRVLMARVDGSDYAPLEAEFWMVGRGQSMLEIRDVDHRYIKRDAIRVGDAVLTVPGDMNLPVSMVVGEVTGIEQDSDSSLIYRLEVKPAVDYDALRKVFVVDPAG